MVYTDGIVRWFGRDLRGRLMRGEAFAFAAWVLLCRPVGDPRPGDLWSPVLQVALDELLEAFPQRDADGKPLGLSDRLALDPDPAVMRDYFERLMKRGYEGQPWGWRHGEALWWWEVADAWDAIREHFRFDAQVGSVGRAPRRVNPLVRDATPASALAALARHPGDTGPDIDSEDAMWVEAGLIRCMQLANARDAKKKTVPESRRRCPRCREWYVVLRPEDHIVNCPEHPAWIAWQPIRDGLHILDGDGGTEVAPRRVSSGENTHAIEPWCVDYSFEKWCRGEQHDVSQISSATGWVDQPDTPPRAIVSNALRAWARMVDPRVRCPLCSAAMQIEELADHLWTCRAHPAFRAAERLGPEITARLGEHGGALRRLGSARVKAQEVLRTLLAACERFSSDQGWNGQAAYSEAWCEKPWLDAMGAARRQLARLELAVPSVEGLSGAPKHRADAMRRELERAHAATRALLTECHAYWNGAESDSNPSHSVYSERADDAWRGALAKAKAALTEGGQV